MSVTPELKSYLQRLSDTDPELAGKIFGYEEEEDIVPETSSEYRNITKPEGSDSNEYQSAHKSRSDYGLFSLNPDWFNPQVTKNSSDKSDKDLANLQEEMDSLKRERKGSQSKQLLPTELDFDQGKDEIEDYAATIDQIQKDKSNIRNTPSQLDKDRANIRNTPVEEEEDDWWSKIKAALDFDFGGGGMLSGVDGGQDRNVRLSKKWKSGQVPRAKGR
jgi:hypothetical protein